MKLTNPTEAELEEAFAIYVAGWTKLNNGEWRSPAKAKAIEETGICTDELEYPPSFLNATTMLLWMEKLNGYEHYCDGLGAWHSHMVCFSWKGQLIQAADWTFPRAAAIALLRAHGVEVRFTR